MYTLNKKIKAIVFTLIIAIAIPFVSKAQPMPDSNDVDTPIDGGVSLLIAAGAAFGAKRIKESRKNN